MSNSNPSVPSLLFLSANIVASEIDKSPNTYINDLKNNLLLQPLLPYIFTNPHLSATTIQKLMDTEYFSELLTEDFLEFKKHPIFKQLLTLKQMLSTSKQSIKVSEACKPYNYTMKFLMMVLELLNLYQTHQNRFCHRINHQKFTQEKRIFLE